MANRTLLAAAAFAFTAVLAAAAPARAEGVALRFDFADLRSDLGKVRCGLYATADDFLKKPIREAVGAIVDKHATCEFSDVPSGTYALAAWHDANDNGKLDTGVFGIPTEGLAWSNNARGFAGPPKWKNVIFPFSGAPVTQALKFRY